MQKIGIICEYNPLHLGHQKQFHMIRDSLGPDCGIVCLMSGRYVQRGAPAIFNPAVRAKAAILSGADLVLELPTNYALSSAEGFAAGGVRILSDFCDHLCFGSESMDGHSMMRLAEALLSPAFSAHLKEALSTGCSFPAARQTALKKMAYGDIPLSLPNDILAVEYCKAILKQGSSMTPFPIIRQGNYHSDTPDSDNPSATSLRKQILSQQDFLSFVPVEAQECFRSAAVHTLESGERAILARLRTMTDAEFEALPFGSEGLWRKLMHACRSYSSLGDIISAAKSKRYTRTRLDRMVMCAFLGITAADLAAEPPYTRVLAFNDRGRQILKSAKQTGNYLNAGKAYDHPYFENEKRWGSLYGLFSVDMPGSPDSVAEQRIFYAAGERKI